MFFGQVDSVRNRTTKSQWIPQSHYLRRLVYIYQLGRIEYSRSASAAKRYKCTMPAANPDL
jgi:hypothetical protein